MQSEITIFYADDDSDDLEIFRDAAENIGRKVRLFTHNRGDKLLAAIQSPPVPHIIFLDLNMPGKDGFEVLNEIKTSKAYAHIPVVIFSTSSDPRNIEKTRLLGANFYITKPDTFEALQNSINHTVGIDWKSFLPTSTTFVYSKSA